MSQRNTLLDHEREKVTCDRCGFTFRDGDLVEQRGLMVCDKCTDEPSYKEHDDER